MGTKTTTKENDSTPEPPEAPPPPMDAFPPPVEEEAEKGSTADSATQEENGEPALPENETYECGDHVYQWCSLLGIPGVFQHHGIVIDVQETVGEGGEDEQLLTIADFSNLLLKRKEEEGKEEEGEEEEAGKAEESSSTPEGDDATKASKQKDVGNKEETSTTAEPIGTSKTPTQQPLSGSFLAASGPLQCADNNTQKSRVGGLRVYRTTSTTKGRGKWHKVQYADKSWFLSHLMKRSGTFTPVESDPPERVLQRVRFLMAQANYNHTHEDTSTPNSDLLPHYHSIFANCECVAVWCKTGVWSTLQAASMLGHAAVGQAKATATLAGAAAASTVSVPSAGVWGWLGYTSSVPLMTANPFVLPALVAFGAVTVGGPTLTLMAAKRRWKATTEKLNKAMEEDSEARQVEATLVT